MLNSVVEKSRENENLEKGKSTEAGEIIYLTRVHVYLVRIKGLTLNAMSAGVEAHVQSYNDSPTPTPVVLWLQLTHLRSQRRPYRQDDL